jgi:uncharacterized protein with ATP-grasp and redox domains
MKLEPECVGCFFNQIMRALNKLKPEIPSEIILKAQRKLMRYMLSIDFSEEETPIMGMSVYKIISETLNDEDPYKLLKKQYNQLALDHFSEIEKMVDQSEDAVFKAIVIAAIANTIDFGSQHKFDFVRDLKDFNMNKLVLNDYNLFKEDLKNIKNILVIGDNSGEIVYDKLLISKLKAKYPEIEMAYAVRSAPIINDVTLEDAKFVNMDELAKVIEGCPTPGVDLNLCSEEFKHHFFLKKNMIISKGQGNFESLYGLDFPDLNIYYLLKAKCNLMERLLNVRIGDFIFKKKTKGF